MGPLRPSPRQRASRPDLAKKSDAVHSASLLPESNIRSSSWIPVPLLLSRSGTSILIGFPPSVVTRPPASATINAPAATSHGFRLVDQKASSRPAAMYARLSAADPDR